MSVTRAQRFSRSMRCPVCGGCDQDPRDKGKRCTGYLSTDGDYIHCSREELAGGLTVEKEGTYAHRRNAVCRCGQTHGNPVVTPTGPPQRIPIEATYDYCDERGDLLFQVVRKQGKRFMQRRPDGAGGWEWKLGDTRRVLYRLVALLAAPDDATIYVTEGEKDANRLAAIGLVSTCNPHGAGKWSHVEVQARELLRGRNVVVCVDDDDPGRAHAEYVAKSLTGYARSVTQVKFTPHKDVADWMAAGGNKAKLASLVDESRKSVAKKPSDSSRSDVASDSRLSDAEATTTPAAPMARAEKSRKLEIVKGDWTRELLRKKKEDGTVSSQIRSIVANAVTILVNDPHWAGVLAYDEFAETIVTRKAPPWRAQDSAIETSPGDWTDEDTIRTQCWLSATYDLDLGDAAVIAAVKVSAHRCRVHPVRDWLASLRWDGAKRGHTWLVDVFGCPDVPYVRAVGQAFLVASVARAMQPGCKVDTVPILEGSQGIGKSSVLRALVGDEWFLEMSISDVTNLDAMQVLKRKWIAEMPEIDGWSKTETSHFKGYVSRQVDTYRPSYGRASRDFPRQTCFVGTTNGKEYLRDETGGRRFWPVECSRGDVLLVRAIRDQLWAEALARYESGEEWHVTDPELLDVFSAEQDSRYRTDPWEQPIASWLAAPVDKDFRSKAEHGVTTADVITHALGIERWRQSPAEASRAGAILRRLGWVQGRQERRDGARVRPYRPADPAAASGALDNVDSIGEPIPDYYAEVAEVGLPLDDALDDASLDDADNA